jgi:hypothetical protein
MGLSVDDVANLSVMIMRGDPGWLVSLATRPDEASQESNVTDYEFADTRWDKSLVETEVLVTAWLAGRGFVIRRLGIPRNSLVVSPGRYRPRPSSSDSSAAAASARRDAGLPGRVTS